MLRRLSALALAAAARASGDDPVGGGPCTTARRGGHRTLHHGDNFKVLGCVFDSQLRMLAAARHVSWPGMYHDQGLPVIKHLGFGRAVNVTLGLPIVRTSVDHGTAFDLAGTGTADEGSLIKAIEVAARMAAHRRDK